MIVFIIDLFVSYFLNELISCLVNVMSVNYEKCLSVSIHELPLLMVCT